MNRVASDNVFAHFLGRMKMMTKILIFDFQCLLEYKVVKPHYKSNPNT